MHYYMFLTLFVIELSKRVDVNSSKCPLLSIKFLTFNSSSILEAAILFAVAMVYPNTTAT